MKASQLIILHILKEAHKRTESDKPDLPEIKTGDELQEFMEVMEENIEFDDLCSDIKSDLRGGTVNTDIKCSRYSRHYESRSVGAEIEGRWIGWTYWYGGGKHGQPWSIDWVEDAYFLDVRTETVEVQVFTEAAESK